jgi:diphthamide synthase (EF-2-diphthine--ammonia ligase)
MDLSEYAEALRNLKPGDAAEVELGDLSSRAMKRRVGQAAKQMGYNLKWARDTTGNALRFRVAEDQQRKPRNGRRTRKTA